MSLVPFLAIALDVGFCVSLCDLMEKDSYARVTKVLQDGYLEDIRRVMQFYHFETESKAFDFCARRGLEAVRAQMEQTMLMRSITPQAMAEAMRQIEESDGLK